MIDIDRQFLAETALVERTKLLQTVMDTVPGAGITMRDRDNRYLMVNAEAARLLGVDCVDDVLGKTIGEVREDPHTQWVGDVAHAEIVRTGRPLNQERAGQLDPSLWRLLNAAPVIDANGTITAVVEVSLDITALIHELTLR
ncbi:MAG: PAS domain S-box protein [Chromatiales bacterium]|jgi:PAS domain S-box-containing protein|nr:PAS domain S-box protein [Chromatiales bacterium]